MDRPPKMQFAPEEYSLQQKMWFYYNQGYNNGFSAGFNKGKKIQRYRKESKNIKWVRNQGKSPSGQKVVFYDKTVNTDKNKSS